VKNNGLALIKGKSGRLIDNARKDLCKLFRQYDLKITSQVNYQKVNFLDVTLDLRNESYQSFMHKINNIEMVECMVFGQGRIQLLS
jgi:hypothetical protein